jgi:hypothetical protein
VVSVMDPYGRIFEFLDRSRYIFPSSNSSVVLARLIVPVHYLSEDLVAPGIEPGPQDLYSELWLPDHRGGNFFLNKFKNSVRNSLETHYSSATHVTPLTPQLYSRS